MPDIAKYYQAPRAEMVRFVPNEAFRILDIGCGAGAFGALLKAKNAVEVVGVELDSHAATEACLHLDRVFNQPIEQVDPSALGKFDCVVLNDVLEHLTDPWGVLRWLHGVMNPNAVVVASIPNIRSFPVLFDLAWRGRWEYQDSGVLDRTHLRFFTKSSMQALLETTGYRLEVIEGINYIRLPLPVRALNRAFRGRFYDMSFTQFAMVGRLANA